MMPLFVKCTFDIVDMMTMGNQVTVAKGADFFFFFFFFFFFLFYNFFFFFFPLVS